MNSHVYCIPIRFVDRIVYDDGVERTAQMITVHTAITIVNMYINITTRVYYYVVRSL